MEKKYEVLRENTKEAEDGTLLYQIRLLKDAGFFSEGTLGGYIESEENLSQEGLCWVDKGSVVYGKAKVVEAALVLGNSVVAGRFGGSPILGRSTFVGGTASIQDAVICCGAQVDHDAIVQGAKIGKGGTITSDDDYLVVGGVDTVYRNSTDVCVWAGENIMSVEDYIKRNHSSRELSNMLDVYFAGPNGVELDPSEYKNREVRKQAQVFLPQSPVLKVYNASTDRRMDAVNALLKQLSDDKLESAIYYLGELVKY